MNNESLDSINSSDVPVTFTQEQENQAVAEMGYVNMAEPTFEKKEDFTEKAFGDDTQLQNSNKQNARIQKKFNEEGIIPFTGKTKIFGCPFSWMDSVDTPYNSYSGLGRVYAQNFINDAPLVYFRVGIPQFMPGNASAETQKKIIQRIVTESEESVELDNATTLRYYGFKNCFPVFANNFERLFQDLANRMGLYSPEYKWHKPNFLQKMINQSFIEGTYNTDKYFFNLSTGDSNIFSRALINTSLCFYSTEIGSSESIRNSTTESKLAGAVKSSSNMVREAQFLFGINKAAHYSETDIELYNEKVKSEFEGIMSSFDGVSNTDNKFTRAINTLTRTGKATLSGGNVLFPSIWADSEYTKDYTLNFKFSTPYGHPESILEHVYLPAFLLFSMAMPKQVGPMGYESPYLIKAYAKGNFVCDLGIIDSVSFVRDNSCEWTMDSLPTSLNVQVTIKDLYNVLMLTAKEGFGWASNTSLKEFLNTFAGITFSQVDPTLFINKKWQDFLGAVNIPAQVGKVATNAYNTVLTEIGSLLKGGF